MALELLEEHFLPKNDRPLASMDIYEVILKIGLKLQT